MKIRIKFAKYGPMKFIGHLDTMRFFQKAIRRSGIDVSYSTGFSPHQIMAFAAPLGVGLESDAEYLDLEVGSITSSYDMKKRLADQMAEGFEIKKVGLLNDDAPNAMASVMGASYLVNFRNDREPSFSLVDGVEQFWSKESVIVTKKTKKSEKELDLKPSVYELKVVDDGLYMCVDASSGGNIKPDLVVNVLFSFYNDIVRENALMIKRLETYGRDSDGLLVPLSSFGKDFE